MLLTGVIFVITVLLVYLLIEGERQGWWEQREKIRFSLVLFIALSCVAGVVVMMAYM